jgi:DNA-binding response OmpR family regulator
MKVLIADPDWYFAELAQYHLESRAHLVVHQANPFHALAQARRWQPDVAIVSAEPAFSGLMQKLYTLQPRPAILLVDHMDRFARAWRAWQRGGDELLLKPILRFEELHDSLVGALENAAVDIRAIPLPVAASA